MDIESIRRLADELGDVLPTDTLTQAERHELIAHIQLRRFARGEILYHRGDPAGDVFLIQEGLVKSQLQEDDGRDLLLGYSGRGDFMGAESIFDHPRQTTVRAVHPTVALQIRRTDAMRVLERNPRAALFTFERLVAAAQKMTDILARNTFLDVPARLAHYLLELRRLSADIPLNQDDIAAAVGTSREWANKLLHRFERQGLIKIEHRQIRILDEEGLTKETRD